MNITTSCNFTTNITAVNAWKACGAIMQQELATDPFVEFRKFAFGSALYMIIVALIAIVANALLLVVFLVDPLKMLRSPPSYFLIGLAMSDLLTALILLPIYSGCFIMLYLQTPQSGLLLCRDVLLHVGLTQGGNSVNHFLSCCVCFLFHPVSGCFVSTEVRANDIFYKKYYLRASSLFVCHIVLVVRIFRGFH